MAGNGGGHRWQLVFWKWSETTVLASLPVPDTDPLCCSSVQSPDTLDRSAQRKNTLDRELQKKFILSLLGIGEGLSIQIIQRQTCHQPSGPGQPVGHGLTPPDVSSSEVLLVEWLAPVSTFCGAQSSPFLLHEGCLHCCFSFLGLFSSPLSALCFWVTLVSEPF